MQAKFHQWCCFIYIYIIVYMYVKVCVWMCAHLAKIHHRWLGNQSDIRCMLNKWQWCLHIFRGVCVIQCRSEVIPEPPGVLLSYPILTLINPTEEQFCVLLCSVMLLSFNIRAYLFYVISEYFRIYSLLFWLSGKDLSTRRAPSTILK